MASLSQLFIFYNPVADLVADFHILGGKPAADPFLLQIGVKALGKGFVSAGVTNKAGVV